MADVPEKELEEELTELSGRIERLRVMYQQYFMGIERFPPTVQREQLERRIRHSPLNEVRRSSIKFRFQSVIQRLRTFEIYWERVLREIEDGRFKRGVFRDGGTLPRDAAMALKEREEKPAPAKPDEKPEKAPKKKKKKAAGKKASAGKEAKKGKVGKEEGLYQEYIEARKSVNQPVDGITRESFDESLKNQRRVQAAKLGADDVSFTVKIKAGKVILEARRKKP